jgi:hypothetical protein
VRVGAVGTFTGPAGTFRQRTEITRPLGQGQTIIRLKAMGVATRPTGNGSCLPSGA